MTHGVIERETTARIGFVYKEFDGNLIVHAVFGGIFLLTLHTHNKHLLHCVNKHAAAYNTN